MPKVKKIRAPALQSSNASSSTGNRSGSHEQPLGQIIQDDIHRTLYATTKAKISTGTQQKASLSLNNKHHTGRKVDSIVDEDDKEYYNDDGTTNVFDEKSSQRIIALSMEQQMEVRKFDMIAAATTATATTTGGGRKEEKRQRSKHTMRSNDSDDDDDNEGDDHTPNLDDNTTSYDYGYVDRTEDGEYVDMVDTTTMGISPQDEAIIASMMKGRDELPNHRTLADIILEKIAQKEKEQHQISDGNEADDMIQQELPPKVVEVYADIGKILARYTSGKLPKAFKVIPSLSNWEDVLYLTRPDRWTPAAMYAATRIFASNCNVKMATKFYNLILLDCIRNDIHVQKKLNFHYYMALKKSIYKPQSFFKGILLPLCIENCTLREAAIVASVLQRVSIPVHHAAVAIHKLATMHTSVSSSTLLSEYSGATSIFLKTLLNKKYSLPAPVIGSVLKYFTNFLNHGTTTTTTIVLPVLWHQALLVFVQRYKNAITMDDVTIRDTFRKLLKQHYHHKITPEIRRELFGSIQAYHDEQQLQQHQQQHQNIIIPDRINGGSHANHDGSKFGQAQAMEM
jgi:essential nuclear protein 1